MNYNKLEQIDLIRMTEGLLDFSGICYEEMLRAGQLADKIENSLLTVSVIGQFKRGKSSLINTMLGKPVLPVGIVPITSVVTRIEAGQDGAFVKFLDGRLCPVDTEELSHFINEQTNPDNMEGVESVTIHRMDEFVAQGITLVDTPGVGSIHKHNTTAAYDFVQESDGVVFMLSVDSPINEIEIDFLKNAKDFAGRFYFVVNKIDVISDDELEDYLAYCQNLLANILELSKEEVKLMPVSAKTGRGVEEFKNFLLEDCRARTAEIMEQSALKKLDDIIERGLMRMTVYWNATRMSRGNFDFHFNKLKEAIAEAKQDFYKKVEKDAQISHSDLVVAINLLKMRLTEAVNNEFEIQYSYELEEIIMDEDGQKIADEKTKRSFSQQADKVCANLDSTLSVLLLYREDDSIVIAKRTKRLKVIRQRLRDIRKALWSLESKA